jgi:hypothetical protein
MELTNIQGFRQQTKQTGNILQEKDFLSCFCGRFNGIMINEMARKQYFLCSFGRGKNDPTMVSECSPVS